MKESYTVEHFQHIIKSKCRLGVGCWDCPWGNSDGHCCTFYGAINFADGNIDKDIDEVVNLVIAEAKKELRRELG